VETRIVVNAPGRNARAAFALLIAVGFAGCHRDRRVRVQTDEEPPRLAMMLSVADPRAATQLINGFYSLENNSWRWTAGKFTVMLRPPRAAETNGAVLKFKFNLPEAVLSKVKTLAISANVNGTALSPESYTQPGEYTYTREVPPKAFTGDAAKVEFTLDKFLPPSSSDLRELGVIATMVGFEGK